MNDIYGVDHFKLYNNDRTYICDKHCTCDPDDVGETVVFRSIFTKKGWVRNTHDFKQWIVIIHGITWTEYIDLLKPFEGVTAFFQPHKDRPEIEYDVEVYSVLPNYEDLDYYKDEVVMIIKERNYR